MMRTLLLLTGVSFTATAQIVESITWTGIRAVDADDLEAVLTTKTGRPFDPTSWSDDLRTILNVYRQKHFYLVSIDSVRITTDSTCSITVFITENRPIEIGPVRVTVNGEPDHPAMDDVKDGLGGYFDPDVFSRALNRLAAGYESRGYPLVRVAVQRVSITERPSIEIDISVIKGPHARLRDVRFDGLASSRPEALKREMRLPLPMAYDTRRIDQGLSRIRKLPYIAEVGEPLWLAVNDTTYDLIVPVREGRSNRLDGVAGYVPRQPGSSEKAYVTAFVEMSFTNLTGTGRRLDFRWHKPTRRSQDFFFSYTEPWVMGYPVRAGISINQRIQDTLYVDRQLSIRTSWQLLPDASIDLGATLQNLQPSSDRNGFIFSIPTSRIVTASVGLTYDRRNNSVNPTSGVYYHTHLDYLRKRERSIVADADGADTLTVDGQDIPVSTVSRSRPAQRLFLDVLMFYPIGRRWVLFEGIHAAFYRFGERTLPLSEQFRLGGLHDVRGYVEDFYLGSRVGWNNLELRYLTSPRSRIFVFFDAGHYFRYEPRVGGGFQKRSGWPVGYGFGMRVDTRLGIFALDYGLGRGDEFNNGKVHFGLTSEF
jgi:outer membrane protein assembly factor BamA